MSTFLELVQSLHRESGAAGVAPSSVENQRGEANRLVGFVREADYKIQTKWINWKFLREEFNTGNTTTASVRTLAKPNDLKTWDLNTFKIIYPGQTIEYPLTAVEYEKIKGRTFDVSIEGPPSYVIVMPDNSLQFEPTPDGAYTILADYYRKPVKMTVNASVSLIPEEYHETAILGLALIRYANFESAPEAKAQGLEWYEEGLAELENHQLPNQNYSRMRTGGGFEVVADNGDWPDDGWY